MSSAPRVKESDLGQPEVGEKTVGHKLDILLHQAAVHSNQVHRQGFRQELLPSQTGTVTSLAASVQGKVAAPDLLDANSFGDDVLHSVLRRLLHQIAEQQAGKCTMQALNATQVVKRSRDRCQPATLT